MGGVAPQSPAGSGIVVAATPVAVVSGVGGSVPYPTNVSDQLRYVLIQNSTPFTLVIAQGLTLGQVPAFTAEVFVLAATGQPISYTPVKGSGIIVPGTDSTLYVTWSQYEPFGTWPAAIGSGAVPFAADTLLFTGNGPNVLDGAVSVSTPVSVLGYGGMTVTTNFVARTGGLGAAGAPYRVVMDWATDNLFTSPGSIVARRQFIVAGGSSGGAFSQPHNGAATFMTPHFADWLRFALVAPTIGSGLVQFSGQHRQNPNSGFLSPLPVNLLTGGAVDLMGGLFTPGGTVLAAGTSATLTSLWPYEGPISLFAGWGFNAAAFNDWRVILSAQDESGATWRIDDWQATPGILSAVDQTVIVPPTILSLFVQNNTAAGHTVTVAATPDVTRMAA